MSEKQDMQTDIRTLEMEGERLIDASMKLPPHERFSEKIQRPIQQTFERIAALQEAEPAAGVDLGGSPESLAARAKEKYAEAEALRDRDDFESEETQRAMAGLYQEGVSLEEAAAGGDQPIGPGGLTGRHEEN